MVYIWHSPNHFWEELAYLLPIQAPFGLEDLTIKTCVPPALCWRDTKLSLSSLSKKKNWYLVSVTDIWYLITKDISETSVFHCLTSAPSTWRKQKDKNLYKWQFPLKKKIFMPFTGAKNFVEQWLYLLTHRKKKPLRQTLLSCADS